MSQSYCICGQPATGASRCAKCGAALCPKCAGNARAHAGIGPECHNERASDPQNINALDSTPLTRPRGPK